VEIRGNQAAAVIDVDDIAGEKEVVDQRDDTAIGGAHGLAHRSAEINAEVATGHPSVEQTPGSEFTRDR
jgi:metallophosphoesterase superfamily enzyme